MSKILYDLSLIKAVVFDVDGVLSPVTVEIDANGLPRRMTNLRDGYAIVRTLRTNAIKICIISGADAENLRYRFNILGVKDIFLGVNDKLEVLSKWMDSYALKPSEVAYVGDDIPDIAPLKRVGLSVCPRDAASEVKDCAKYITHSAGGYGVARELLEEILKFKGLWPSNGDIAYGK